MTPFAPSTPDHATTTAIDRLRHLTTLDVQAHWRWHAGDLPLEQAIQTDRWHTWETAPLNARQHIAWGRGRQILWLAQQFVVPQSLSGYPLAGLTLRLGLTWWADDARVYVNGQLVQVGDLFDCAARIELSDAVVPGQIIAVAIRLVSSGHDDGALVRSVCLYERPDYQMSPCPEPGFVADELAVLHHYLTTFAPETLPHLHEAIAQLDWAVVTDASAFDQALIQLRHQLQPLGQWPKQRTVALLGHAHLDLAWLWPVHETWEVAERTFESVLQLQAQYPELLFCHSTPALYAWLEAHRPELLHRVRHQIAKGRWEVAAGLWVEPELNLINGESLARQVLYGQRYVESAFGQVSAIAWLPDSFGFCWQLPQILRQGEVSYFVTQKLRWNDTNPFPHELFDWQAPDGSQVLSLHSAPIGEGVDPLKMAHYATQWELKTGRAEALWLIGVGDHGGGPTRDMLELAQRWQRSPFFPQVTFTTAQSFLDRICADRLSPSESSPEQRSIDGSLTNSGENTRPKPTVPVWHDELYLEFHRGCYTTHADQKQWNRRCEDRLYEAEVLCSLANLALNAPYPQTQLEAAWKQVLFNQFHDILPGSAIPEVFVDANQGWQAALTTAQTLRDEALEAIAQAIALPPPPHPDARPFVVFNPLTWARSAVVRLPLESASTTQWGVCDRTGQEFTVQIQPQTPDTPTHLLIQIPDLPGLGYRTLWLYPQSTPSSTHPTALPASQPPHPPVIENRYLRVTIDPATGNLLSIIDRVHQREVLAGPGNELQAFRDDGQYWDAWNIDPDYASHPLPPAELIQIEAPQVGAVESSLRVVRKIGHSVFDQRYVLQVDSPILHIRTHVEWHERHTLVKAAFALALDAEIMTCEIPFGAIEHPTCPVSATDRAKWEVPALRWADVSDGEYGVSLLNDSKYGYDCGRSQIRLSLLRGSTWPDPNADQGHHHFTYALFPHAASWQTAHTVRQGYALNQPPLACYIKPDKPFSQNSLAPEGQFLRLSSDNLVLSALKPSDDAAHRWILRLYECHGQPADLKQEDVELQIPIVQGNLAPQRPRLKTVSPTNLLERPTETLLFQTLGEVFTLSPWTICTLSLAVSQ